MELTKPQFIDIDADAIISEMVADYEAATGKKLAPAQVERLLINAFAYREYILRTAINETALQNMVEFASFPALDYLGDLVGVKRLPASQSKTTIRFNLVDGHTGIVLPAGVRVQSVDGKAVFQTTESKVVITGTASVDVVCECTEAGVIGNGYAIGDISIMLDPQAYVSDCANTTVSSAGADDESDDALRERIKLAPASFSCAGPKGAYIYWAKSAHASIIDVAVTSPEPGDVYIYPLLEGGITPSIEIIDAVKAACNSEKRRPLSDTVYVESPTKIEYDIEVNLTLLNDAVEDSVISRVTANLEAYAAARKKKMGIDVVINQIINKSNIDGVYKATVVSPEADIEVDEDEFADCGTITVNVIGTSDE
ncbi:MAG: baseplate J/gp47 family protein [Chitinophagaceae bacterium]|nr:baseplate J/gp47 family protein [Chitinophagaceae bacterium]